MNRTEEQAHIVNLASTTSDNIMINSYAGTGKSTTLDMLDWECEYPEVLYLVFNKRNADEAKAKQKGPEPKIPSTTTIKTFNGWGHGIWQSGFSKRLTLDKTKTRTLLKQIIEDTPRADRGPMWDVYWDVIAGVEKAKAIGYCPPKWAESRVSRPLADAIALVNALEEQPDELTWDLINSVLTASIRSAYEGLVDFNDQVYMPALFGGSCHKFPCIKVDEYQDLNPVNHAMLARFAKGRIIGVGDPHQNIYGFRGAAKDGMRQAIQAYRMTECELTVSFRCPQKVVEAARWKVPNFKWIKPGGHVERLKQLHAKDLGGDETFICRNNAPLFRLGMQLLGIGKPITIVGSDIGPRLIGIMRKLGPEDLSRTQTLSAIEDWRTAKLSKDSTSANDLADCMAVFALHGDSLGQAIKYAEFLFQQTGSIRLLTGHKSKGLEFDKVYLLDTFLLKEEEQDLNLRYVMQTRSADHLYEIDSAQMVF